MYTQTNQGFNDQTNIPVIPGGQMYPPMMNNGVVPPGNTPGYAPAYGQPIMTQPVMPPTQPIVQNQPNQVIIKEKESDNSAECCCAGCLAGCCAAICCCCLAAAAADDGPHGGHHGPHGPHGPHY